MLRRVASVLVGCVVSVFGCDAPDADEVTFRDEVENGQVLNSAVLNGLQFNGLQFNGLQFNGLQFNGSSFSGTLAGVPKSGLDFEGAEIKLSGNGTEYTLRFDDIYKDPARPNDDVYFYDISVREGSGPWTSLCKDPAGNPVAAIPLANYWNYTSGARVDDTNVVTFACRGAALAKCVEWGYIPWHTAEDCKNGPCQVISLKEHHQACTRMVRADYCGDGRSYTFDHTPIDIFDRLKVRIQSQTTQTLSAWSVEAEWGPNGATCVGDELRMQMYDTRGVPYSLPTCLDAIDDFSNCGNFSRPASRVADSYCSAWTTNPAACESKHNDDK